VRYPNAVAMNMQSLWSGGSGQGGQGRIMVTSRSGAAVGVSEGQEEVSMIWNQALQLTLKNTLELIEQICLIANKAL